MTILFSNNASSTVAGSISATDTTVTIQSGTAFPHPLTVGDYFCATFYDQQTKTLNEIVHVTSLVGNVATIVRGQEGTTPLAWNAGDIFANLVTAGTLAAFPQQGAVPVNTTDVYVGDDVSTNANHIICNTVPVPAAYALGMLFLIRIKNTNNGPTDLTLNGKPAVLAKRTDGSDVVGGNFLANQEYAFIWNGTFFQSTIQPVPQKPPFTTFYVRTDSISVVDVNGIESNSGFFNTAADAFLTLQGAINTIKSRYVSTQAITLRVADGTYTSGIADNDQYVASWIIIGNEASPANCIINCTSTVASTYVPGAQVGQCVDNGHLCKMLVAGFTFRSYFSNCEAWGGDLTLRNNNYNGGSVASSAVIATQGANLDVIGNNHYTTTIAQGAVFQAAYGGNLSLGEYSSLPGGSLSMQLTMNGSYTLTTICLSGNGGGITIADQVFSANGPSSNCYTYYVYGAGGISFGGGNDTVLNSLGSKGGYIEPNGPKTCGGWKYP